MRTLAIDCREALSEKPTGKARWAHCFLTELLTRTLPVLLLGNRDLPSAWQVPHVRSVVLPSGMRWHLHAARLLNARHRELTYFSPTSYIVPFLAGGALPTIPLVHDLIAFRGEPHQRKAQMIERLTLRRALAQSCHVCTVSEATKHDLLNRYGFLGSEHISVIFAGPYSETAPIHRPDGRTILSVGTLCPRKNQIRLIRAFAALPEIVRNRSRLVIAGGRGWHDREIVRLARETPGVEWRGYVTDAEYESLLSNATVFALPSLYEGFGMPVLDALQRGIPVLTSKRGSLPEVAGDAALFVDPEDQIALTQGLKTLLGDDAVRMRLSTAGPQQAGQFNWKRTVDLFLSGVQAFL
ncbi:MAG: glycosyltransferase family 1 protein [Candidatus Peribacteraceae bacterium]|nr:glycosyltransferase family 1 protein [Candidatus Peribacteraceae bacterium]MDD5742853.1 glycosyltransferase family 1 protein [Candidatus Peribacteraceae bacterium]